jgi:hypothetical protein
MIVPALLRGSIDFRYFLGGGGEWDGGDLTCVCVGLFVHSEQVKVYLFWAMRFDRPLCFDGQLAPHRGQTSLCQLQRGSGADDPSE